MLQDGGGNCRPIVRLLGACRSPQLIPAAIPRITPHHPGALLGFLLCSSCCTHLGKGAAFALAKQGGVFSFPYDRLVGINKIDKSKKVTGMAVNKLF